MVAWSDPECKNRTNAVGYKPINIAPPHSMSAAPDKACVYRSKLANESAFMPASVSRTITSMVVIVAMANTPETMNIATQPCCNAGSMRMGMSGSHGPKTKMVNSIQGVSLTASGVVCACKWSPPC